MLLLAVQAHSTFSVSTIATVATLSVAVLALLGLVYRVARRIETTLGKDTHGRTLNERMDRVEHQVWPNGGTSLADKVNNIERQGIETRASVRLLGELYAGKLLDDVQPADGSREK